MTRQRLPALDGLRGVGALMVVAYHALLYSDGFRKGMYHFDPTGPGSWLVTISPLRVFFDGRVAVLSFFVLSGFVLSRGFWRGKPTRWIGYYVRRGLRLYPPVLASGIFAVIMLGLTQVFTGRGNGLVDFEAAGTSVSHFAQNMGLLGLTWSPLNVVWWSMRWEVWFSILLPVFLVVLAVAGCGPNRRFRATPLVFGVACVCIAAAQPWAHRAFQTPPYLSRAQLYLPMFGVGIALAAFESAISESRWLTTGRRGWIVAAVAFAILATRGPLGALRQNGTIDRVLATGLMQGLSLVGVAIVVVLLVGWPRAISAFSTRPVHWVGERSYSLYLVHLPLIGLLGAMLRMRSAPLWFVALCVAVSLAVTVPFHRFVEAPSTRLSSRFGRSRRPRAEAERDPGSAERREPIAVG